MAEHGETTGRASHATRARAIGLCLLALVVAGGACSESSSATDAGAKRDVGTTPDAQTMPDAPTMTDAGDASTDVLLVAPKSDASAERGDDARADVAPSDAQPFDAAPGDAQPSDVPSGDATGEASNVGRDDASASDGARVDASAADVVASDASNPGSSNDAGASDVSQHLATPTYLGTYGVHSGPYVFPTLAVAPDGSMFFGGEFDVAQDFDPGPNVDMRTPQGMYDAFLTKLNADGSYAWTLTFGGPQSLTSIAAIAVSETAIVVGGGYSDVVDFDPGPGTHETAGSAINGPGGFVMSLTRDGAFNWVSPFVGAGGCGSSVLALDADGSVYVGGGYSGACDFDPGPASINARAMSRTDSWSSSRATTGTLCGPRRSPARRATGTSTASRSRAAATCGSRARSTRVAALGASRHRPRPPTPRR